MLKFNVVVKSIFVCLFMMGNACASDASLPENQPLIKKYSVESGQHVEHLAVFITMYALIAKAQAENKPEVADFVGRNTFGNDWTAQFEVAKQMHEINGYGNMSSYLMDCACNVMQLELLRKAPTGDVNNFLRRSFDECLATHTMHRVRR